MIDDPLNRLSVTRGSQRYNAKLTEEDVTLIRQLIRDREHHREQLRRLTNRAIAEKFDVTHSCIDKISAGEAWIHVQ